MEFTAQQIADFIQGKVEGDSTVRVSNFSKIEDGQPGTLSFLSNPKYNQYIYQSNASIILVNNDFIPEQEVKATLIRVPNAYEALALLMSLVEQSKPKTTGVSEMAYISRTAVIAENVYIAPFVFIGEHVVIGKNVRIHAHCSIEQNSIIGDNTVLYAGVKIYSDTRVGNNCMLHAGVVLGSDGFGFAPTGDGSYKKIPQMGNVIIEDDVEIGANATVDRATLGSTVICKGVKLDNLVQIAHNAEIGTNTVIASQSGVAGSTKVGRQCIIAGQVGIAGHIQVAEGTILGAQTGVANSIKTPNQAFQGYPAIPVNAFRRSTVVYKNLSDLQKMLYELQRKVTELENKTD